MVHVNGDMAFVQVLEKAREDLVVKITLAVVGAELHARETLVEPAIELLEVRLGAKGRHGDKRYQATVRRFCVSGHTVVEAPAHLE